MLPDVSSGLIFRRGSWDGNRTKIPRFYEAFAPGGVGTEIVLKFYAVPDLPARVSGAFRCGEVFFIIIKSKLPDT